MIIHNDLPSYDWKTVFDLLNGRSFYKGCLPSNFLTILSADENGTTPIDQHFINVRKKCH